MSKQNESAITISSGSTTGEINDWMDAIRKSSDGIGGCEGPPVWKTGKEWIDHISDPIPWDTSPGIVEPLPWQQPLGPQPWGPLVPAPFEDPYHSKGIMPKQWPKHFPGPGAGWPPFDEEAKRQERERIQKEKEAAGRAIAEGAESAKAPVGARKFLRDALELGTDEALHRFWAQVMEKGWEKEMFETGKAETLARACAGAHPKKALRFLSEKGFSASFEVATQIMLSVLAAGQERAKGIKEALDGLVELFKAGSLNPETLDAIEKKSKGLAGQAKANAEEYELRALSCQPEKKEGKEGGPLRV